MTGLCRPSSWFVSTVRSRPFLASWLLAALAAGSIGCSSEITGGGAAGTGNTSTNPPPGSGNGGSSGSNNGTFAGNGQFIPGGSTSQNPSAGRPSTTGGSTGLGGAPPGTAGVPTTPGAGMDTGVGSPPEQLADCKTPGPRLVRRLTAEQFHNTLVDVFDDPNVPAAEVLKDPHALGFHVDADLPTVSDLDAELLMNYAETVAAWAVKNKMWRLTSCTTNDQNCRRSFIQTFGRRLQREALPEERVAAYEQIFMAESTFDKGVEAVAAAMLQSPHTLYRRELGQADPATPGQFVLTPFEVASQLAYFLTETGPDDDLLNAAAQGRLNTRQDLDREAARLLGNNNGAKARRAMGHFVQGWLEIANLPGKAKDESGENRNG